MLFRSAPGQRMLAPSLRFAPSCDAVFRSVAAHKPSAQCSFFSCSASSPGNSISAILLAFRQGSLPPAAFFSEHLRTSFFLNSFRSSESILSGPPVPLLSPGEQESEWKQAAPTPSSTWVHVDAGLARCVIWITCGGSKCWDTFQDERPAAPRGQWTMR